MTDGCCSRFKQIEATIVRYKKSGGKDKSPSVEAEKDNGHFENKVTDLKSKLTEANANIAMLRAFVSQADIDIKKERPQTPKPKCQKIKDVIDELTELIVRLNDNQHQAKVATDRCLIAAKVLDEVENQKCFCALVTASCEDIKQQLANIAAEKEELEETINELQNPSDEEPVPLDDVVASMKNTIADIKACTILSCPKLKNSAMQSAYGAPSKLPMLQSRKHNAKSCCGTTCSKGCGG